MNSRPERPKATRTYPPGGKRNRQTDGFSEADTSKDDRLSKKSSTTKGTNESRHIKTNKSTVSGTPVGTVIGKLTARVSKVFVPPVTVTHMVERQPSVLNEHACGTPINSTLSPRGIPIGFVSRQEMEKRVRDKREISQAKRKTSKASNSTARKGLSADSKGTKASKLKETNQRHDQRENEHACGTPINSTLSPRGIPKGFVSRQEMEKRVRDKREISQAKRKTSKASNSTARKGLSADSKGTKASKLKETNQRHDQRENNETMTPQTEMDNEERSKVPNDSNKVSKRVTRSNSRATKLFCQPQATSISRTAIKTAPLSSVNVLIMNANGKDDKGGTPTDRRKNAISNVIGKHLPHLVLFQEFTWTGITGKTWSKWPIPDNYVFKGHYDASIIYDHKSVAVSDVPATDIDNIVKGLKNNATNRLKRTFPMDFNPVSRMLMSHIVAQTKPALDFICVSWHGLYQKMSQLKRIEYFEYLIEFLRNVKEKYKLPMLVGGDFNIDMYTIEHLVRSPFKLCVYEASVRRTDKGIIDFYIVTEELELSEIKWIDLERDTAVLKPNGVLDHDPVLSELKPAVDMGTGGLGQKKSGISTKTSAL